MIQTDLRSPLLALALLATLVLAVGGCSPGETPDSPATDTESVAESPASSGELAAETEQEPEPEAPALEAESEVPEAVAGGTVHTVVAQGVKFEPMFLYIEPGDTVQWTNMAAHNIETIDSMVPEGQQKILSDMGGEVAVTFENEGVVVYKCTPHWSTRMGGMVVVGAPENPTAIVESYLAAIASDPSALPAKGLLKKLLRDMEEKGLL